MKIKKRKKGRHLPKAVSLRDAMSRIFDESVWDPFGAGEGGWSTNFPKVDVKETKDAIQVKADVPGIDPKDINIEVGDDYMIISGKQEREEKKEEENVHWEERYCGEFRREFTLSSSVDSEQVKAKVKDGVLNIELPKTEKAKAKKIEIEKE